MEAATANVPIAHRGRFRRTVPDERLVERMRDGDALAFELIYDRYHAGLLAFCRHMLGSREEAEDALQHVFVAAHRHLGDPERDIQLRPWLYAVARNRCLSVLRARRESVRLDDVPEPASAGLAVAAEVESRQDLKDMLSDVARLPDDQRAALLLAELGALSHDEIAEALDVRRDKVKALVFQARESLMGWREARQMDCREIRKQLATVRGGALRRAPLRRHLETCAECRDFREEVRRQRAALAIVLPVVPSAALKQNVLAAALATGKAGAVAGGLAATGVVAGAGGIAVLGGANGGGAAALGAGVVGKGVAALALIAGLGGGGYVAVHGTSHRSGSDRVPIARSTPPDRSATHNATPQAALAPTPSEVFGSRGPARHRPAPSAKRIPASSPVKSTPPATSSPTAPFGSAPTTAIAPLPTAPESAPTAPIAPATKDRKGRGPVQHEPGVPVRRGPVDHSNGQGPPPAGTDRGKHDGDADATAGKGKSEDAPGKVKKG